jgi:hypothetical protein
MCIARADLAGRSKNGTGVAGNGMIIEQQQIITTQNLAQLFHALDLQSGPLNQSLALMARHCFASACELLVTSKPKGRDVKNAAYAWRQMVFYLSWLPSNEHDIFLDWATDDLKTKSEQSQQTLLPALRGLGKAVVGQSLQPIHGSERDGEQFLGWRQLRFK